MTAAVLGLATMLCARDLPHSVAFYRDVLGFEVPSETEAT